MKIKTIIFASALSLVSLSAFSDKGGTSGGGAGGGDVPMEFSSRIIISLVSVTVEDSEITTVFRSNLGIVDVTIKDNNGLIVYSESVDTAISSRIVTNTFGLPSGEYNVVVTNINNQTLAIANFTAD